jgi:hypothetical protein
MAMNRIALALLVALAVLLAAYLLRPAPPRPADRANLDGALPPEVEDSEPEPAPLVLDEGDDAQPIVLTEGPEPVPAPLPPADPDGDPVVPAQRLLLERPLLKRGAIDAP